MGKTVLTFGEIMMRLSPKDHLRIEQATEFDVRYGGAEANTALSLAYQGDKAAYVSVVPADRLGECALRAWKTYGVDTTRVVRQGDRLGSYVFEVGASQRGNGCVYDRKFSAINMAKRDVFDWDEILKGIDVFYFSGVTPAVSDEMAAACKEALAVCRAKGITTVCDVNYRGKMWSPEKSQATMKELLPLVDICIANDEDAPAGLGMTCVSGSLAHGIEERGIFRILQFEKQEMIVVCRPEESADWYEKLWKMSVELFRSMEIPVRQLNCCSGDLADLKVKSCDIEAWSPRQQKYFDACSCSNLVDAQARRLHIRVKGKDGKSYLAHTLNNTCVAPPRMLIAFLENHLQAAGSVTIPEVLQPYMCGLKVMVPTNKKA